MSTPSAAIFMDDPNWYAFIPEMKEVPRVRHLPAHEDCSPLDVEATARHLRRGGTLGSMPGYEERAGQIDMARAVTNAFNAREHLMIEAGTGVGKSLAYLVPSILWAITNDMPVVISTATRNLQSQLIGSDIPRALRVLPEGCGNFQVALLKGRTNYVCLRAVAEFFAAGYWTLSPDEQELAEGFIDWLRQTDDGDLDTYDGLPRSLLSCPGEDCSGRRCPFYTRCFVYRARKKAAAAHLIVVNHALVLAEATSTGGILPAYGHVVFDEAHNLEDIATDYLGMEFSVPALTRILNRLARRGRGKRALPGGVLAAIQRQLQKGALSGCVGYNEVNRLIGAAPRTMQHALKAAERLAENLRHLLVPAHGRSTCRFKVVDGVRYHSVNRLFEAYGSDKWDENLLAQDQRAFESALATLVNLLHALRDALDEGTDENAFSAVADLAAQLGGIAESLVGFANETVFALAGAKGTHAYWVEEVEPPARKPYIRCVAQPLSVADDLRELFYKTKDSVVLCSATLRVGNDFKYMSRRLGCDERFRDLVATSPFDYLQQALVLATDHLPDPSVAAATYATKLAEMLRDLFAITHGRALVLFTSYEMMNAVASAAASDLAASGLTLLVQGNGLSRETITHRLREGENTVVFGAQSFWEGVDVSGEALSCVVLARLPFAQVGEPIVEARSERVKHETGDSFRNYALPEAIIKFRQGFGRLIRTKSDRGIVIVTDPRLVTKNYGSVFRRAIPATVHTVTEADDLLRRVAAFL